MGAAVKDNAAIVIKDRVSLIFSLSCLYIAYINYFTNY